MTSGSAIIEQKTPAASCPELLAPAGDWECAKAAVENGADAIYFGLDRFNARMRAHNFTEAALPKLMEFLHRRGVRGYVTFNTLVFTNELSDACEYLRSIIAAGVDAAIVQDVGICRLIRRLSPDFPIHASTQMTVTSAAGVDFARELGCNLVVLARECSISEIEKIYAGNLEGHPSGQSTMPLEVFVHGALCVAYSGQCLTSESLGGRSANRGECAQACRMPYELVSDGQTVPLGDKRYLLSPQDLAGLEVLPELIQSGVASLKIEGRLKTPEYVANITRVYRNALDKIWTETSGAAPKSFEPKTDSSARYDLEMGFSRGLYTGWFRGIDNQKLAHARFGKKRGVYLGEVSRVERDRVLLKLEGPLRQGDGVVFDAGRPDQSEQGGRVYLLDQRQGFASLAFGEGAVDFMQIHRGDKLWKTNDPELDRRLRQTFSGDVPKFRRPLNFEVHGSLGTILTVIARDEEGNVASAQSNMPLATAEKQPLTDDRLQQQLGRLGGTAFKLGKLANRLDGAVLLPVSELNRMRRELVAQIELQRSVPTHWQLNSLSTNDAVEIKAPAPILILKGFGVPASAGLPPELPEGGTPNENHGTSGSKLSIAELPAADPLETRTAELIVLVRNLPQLEATLECGVKTIYCEFEDPKKYREAVSTVRLSSGCADRNAEIWVAPPRIFKTGEDWILKLVRSSEADGYLVRNYDHLKFFKDSRMIGDFSLNVANQLTAEFFLNRFQIERLTASYDLNAVQLEALLRQAPASWFEITLHQHMPMFHMEHCVFCAFLSKGTDYRNCGRPCDTHEVKLRDRVGAEHPLKADAGCRNTVFNSRAQTGAEYFERFDALGARHFRIEFLNESPEAVRQTIAQYRKLLRHEVTGAELWRELKLLNQLGVTRGQIGAEEKVPLGRS